jgi:N-glycosylase/DNA lyase
MPPLVSSSRAAWSAWTPLAGAPRLTAATLAELVDGGQAFRWQREPDDTWLGIWSDNIVRLRLDFAPAAALTVPHEAGALAWSAPVALASRVRAALPVYLFGHDTAAALDALPWRGDTHLARCLGAFPGLTILRQPFGETLLGFLCSATKQIVQIKQMIALLAARHGAPIPLADPAIPRPTTRPCTAPTDPVCHLIGDKPALDPGASGEPINRLPTWAELAAVSEAELRACLLGFRARYIHGTAQFIAAHPGWLEETERLPYAEAKARLCELPGVGEKVADCVLLFGAGKLEAFPVDTWIIKAMARRYALDGWTPAQVSHFGRVHFGAHAGLAQQYLFAYERAAGRG